MSVEENENRNDKMTCCNKDVDTRATNESKNDRISCCNKEVDTMATSEMPNIPCECKDEKREKMLKEIKCLQFAIIELALYLDTHPDDEKALCLHNKYCKEFKDIKDKYQKVYGPLTINYPCNKWRWIEEPWPWEGGIN